MAQEPLKFYINRPLMRPDMSHIPLLYPYLDPVFKDSTPYVNATYRQHMADGSQYRLVDAIGNAEYVLIPHPYVRLKHKDPALLMRMLSEAREAGKPVLADASGDIEECVDFPGSTALRMGQYRFLVRGNEITIPIDVEDLGETFYNGAPPIREKSNIPSLGFSGWAHLNLADRAKAGIKFLPARFKSFFDSRYGALEKGVIIRERALRYLSRSRLIDPKFIKRKSYSGNSRTLLGDPTANREAFVRNLADSDYALSIRGDGNVDMRLYEAMSLGKIPVIVNTERVLPLEDIIDYHEFCVFVDFRKLSELDRILTDYHARVSPKEFKEKQRRARAVFTTYLRPDAFTKYLIADLRRRLRASPS